MVVAPSTLQRLKIELGKGFDEEVNEAKTTLQKSIVNKAILNDWRTIAQKSENNSIKVADLPRLVEPNIPHSEGPSLDSYHAKDNVPGIPQPHMRESFSVVYDREVCLYIFLHHRNY